MPLTRSFKETVQARARRDPAFRAELLREGVDALLAGDLGTGKAILRDYINATVGFDALGVATGTPPKSLIRMFGPRGNPRPATCSPCLATCKGKRACASGRGRRGEPTCPSVRQAEGVVEAMSRFFVVTDSS
jgi:hypothetical protein